MEKGLARVYASVLGMTLLLGSTLFQGTEGSIGVNYGTVANNLPPPAEVAKFLLESTIINRVRLFDTNPEIIRAFAHTGIAVSVTVPTDQIPQLNKLSFAQNWIKSNIQPYVPATNIVRILVGNEVLSTANKLFIANLVPAMQNLHTALVGASLDRRIKVSTPHSLGILSSSSPPSTGKFRQGYDIHVLKPLLSFLRATNSPFMINPYPFFGCSADTLDYALFRPNSGVLDGDTKLTYTNMLDGQLDAVFSAMKALGFTDLEIVIAETGWPSKGDASQFGVDAESAAQYNSNLMRHVTSGGGTPLMPNRTFETYIFALFNEDLKPGPTCERNFGLFQPDMTPVYDIGILRPTVAAAANHHHVTYLLLLTIGLLVIINHGENASLIKPLDIVAPTFLIITDTSASPDNWFFDALIFGRLDHPFLITQLRCQGLHQRIQNQAPAIKRNSGVFPKQEQIRRLCRETLIMSAGCMRSIADPSKKVASASFLIL